MTQEEVAEPPGRSGVACGPGTDDRVEPAIVHSVVARATGAAHQIGIAGRAAEDLRPLSLTGRWGGRAVPAIRPDGPHDAVSSTWWRELAADVGLARRAVQRILRQVTGAAETLIARATGEDGLPATLQRDVRRVIRRRARDLADPR